jgi:hypothetical protein
MKRLVREVQNLVLTGLSKGDTAPPFTTVALLQDQSIEKMHAAFKELLDKREQIRRQDASHLAGVHLLQAHQ